MVTNHHQFVELAKTSRPVARSVADQSVCCWSFFIFPRGRVVSQGQVSFAVVVFVQDAKGAGPKHRNTLTFVPENTVPQSQAWTCQPKFLMS